MIDSGDIVRPARIGVTEEPRVEAVEGSNPARAVRHAYLVGLSDVAHVEGSLETRRRHALARQLVGRGRRIRHDDVRQAVGLTLPGQLQT